MTVHYATKRTAFRPACEPLADGATTAMPAEVDCLECAALLPEPAVCATCRRAWGGQW